MSKIFDLINELCPDGVEFRELREICELERGNTITSKDINDGDIPVISGGQRPAYYHNKYNRDGETITIAGSGAYAGFIMYWNRPIFVADAFSIKSQENRVIIKFVYHFLLSKQEKIYNMKQGAGIPHVYAKDVSKIKLPVPPMEVQREIVRILDSFTLLTAELTAELKARKKQYEFYRDFLLSFDELDKNGGGCELKMLGEILGYTQPANFIVNDTNYKEKFGIPVLTAGQSFLLGYTNETFGIYKALENPTIIFDDFTTSFQWVDFDFKVKSSAIKILNNRDNQKTNFRFVYYAMRCIKFEPTNHERYWISKYSKIKIPIPSLQTQQKVVDILDKFDTLVNSITEGLPREIELRRKQYEYYRELLLNFKPKMTA
ncbi:restriction endonuclease subunit S [Campylobacter concisus]|uniref:restriction endonuclease subunit S n=1 Tax=Campylobacter concisus TaxID=199 RepID=UPI0018840132|nr:restriction endonuclease subunit S [Campylobacter concisus]MBE9852296.1 restriction endonuclease subunit S [Campylobacter concisus]